MKTKSLLSGIAVAALMSLSADTFAQTTTKTGPDYDPKAKTILDGVSATAKAYTSITASFSFTMEKPGATKETKTGSAILKGAKYKITLDTKDAKGVPKKEEYYNNGVNTWVYSEKDNECSKDCIDPNAKKNENQISPTDIFTFHEKGHKYKFVEEKTEGGVVYQYINLFPENPDKKNYHTVKLKIDKAKKQIVSITQLNDDGSKSTYTILTFTPNVTYTDATFQWDQKAHPGVTLIDLCEEEEE